MATAVHNFKITNVIVKSVIVKVVDHLIDCEFAAKMLFHNPTVFVHPF